MSPRSAASARAPTDAARRHRRRRRALPVACRGHSSAPRSPVDRLVLSLRLVPRASVQREWLEQVPEGTCFRSGDVPGASRGAVYAFLSRESAKPRSVAACWRVGPNLYWRPARGEGRGPAGPGQLDIARAITGEGCGLTGHQAGKAAGWLTHMVTTVAEVAVVGEPSVRRPHPGLVLRPRANDGRRGLSPLEVTYLEAVMNFDACAELAWPEALRVTARRLDHVAHLRAGALREVAATERGAGAVAMRARMRELCAVLDGVAPPSGSGRRHRAAAPARRAVDRSASSGVDVRDAGIEDRRSLELRESLGAAPRAPTRDVCDTAERAEPSRPRPDRCNGARALRSGRHRRTRMGLGAHVARARPHLRCRRGVRRVPRRRSCDVRAPSCVVPRGPHHVHPRAREVEPRGSR